ncbi:MAG: hypothetical protein ACOVP5_01215 [Chitinophagales bacterium]
MLQDLIRDVLSDLKYTVEDIEEKSGPILIAIKDLAKKLFFEGKISDFKDFIFRHPNPNSEYIQKEIESSLSQIMDNSKDFIDRLRTRIDHRMEVLKEERTLDGLLKLLNYEHLKGFLKMFGL